MTENLILSDNDQRNVPLEGCTAPVNLPLQSATTEEHIEPIYTHVEAVSTTGDWMETSQILLAESNKSMYNEVLLAENDDQQQQQQQNQPDNEEEEIIEKLKKKAFNRLTRTEKLEIIKARPTPPLRLNSTQKYKTARNFHKRWYDKFKWLCGSAKMDKMYCWPCLLFSNIRHHNIWSDLGHDNLTNIHTSFRQHENSKSHMVAYMKMLKFNRVKFEFRMNAQLFEKSNENSYNEIVKKNRYVIKCLVDMLCTERLESLIRLDNSNNCAQILSEMAKSDCKLRDYLNSTNILVYMTDNILCDVITIIGKVVQVKIKSELELTRFFALFIERIEDINENSFLIIICRFINKHGQIQHRFISFLEVSKFNYSNDQLLQAILNVINELEYFDKLISVAYDRSSFNRDFINQLENAIKKEYKHALLIDFHPPNTVINVFNSIRSTKTGKVFFNKLSGLTLFLLNSTKYDRNLFENIEGFLPNFHNLDWEYPRNVMTVAKYKFEILTLIDHIAKSADLYLSQTYLEAVGLNVCINELGFQLILDLCKTIYVQYLNLMDVLIKNENEPLIYDYKQRLLKKKEKLFKKLQTAVETEQIQSNNHTVTKQSQNPNYDMIKEIYDISIMNLPNTCKIFDKKLLSFGTLLDSKYFFSYTNHFPSEIFNLLKNIYKKTFDYVRLKNELMVIYKTKDFYKENLIILHEYIVYHKLMQVFPEVYKLALLILTIFENNNFIETLTSPIFTIVKNYFKKSTIFNSFTNLPYLVIEQKLVNELWIKELLYNDIMERLSESDHKICLIYK